jgi:hypothetical protein
MSVSTEQIKGFDSEEDRQLLVSLLSEYTEKLSSLSDALEKHRDRKRNYLIGLSIFFAIVFSAFGAIINYLDVIKPFERTSNFLHLYLATEAGKVFIFTVTTLLMCAVTLTTVPSSYWPLPSGFLNSDRKDERLVRDITLLSKKLEKVVQVVSQMQEHSPENVSGRIEMDFRLADAELVLERSISYISSRRKVKVDPLRYRKIQ